VTSYGVQTQAARLLTYQTDKGRCKQTALQYSYTCYNLDGQYAAYKNIRFRYFYQNL